MTDIATSATVAINSLAAEKKARGEIVHNFAAGDPVIPSNPKVIEAVVAAIKTEPILYPPVAGLPELRRISADWMNQKYNCRYNQENTLVTVGGKFGLFAAMQVLLKEGDEVLIPAPYWVSYPQIAKLFNAKPIILPTSEQNQWKLTPEILKKYISAKSKVLILNNAGNPTGNLYSKEELQALIAIADDSGIFIISDEVYSEIVYDDNSFFSCGELSNRLLVIQSCSKNFAMTGWRIGFAFGPEPLIQSMTAIQSQSTTGPSNVCQWAALAAFKNHFEITSYVRSIMQRRRDFFIDTFNGLFQSDLEKPTAALYAFIPLSIFQKSVTSLEMCTELMTKSNIACIPGISFGKEGYLRMAFSEKEEVLREGLLALKKVIKT